MKKILYLFIFLSVMAANVVGQTNSNTDKIPGDAPAKSFLNKDILLGNLQSDTITIEQIRTSDKLTLRSNPNQEIQYYTMFLIIPKSDSFDMFEYNGTGNQLPDDVIEKITSSGASKLFFEHVHIKDESGFKDIGYRSYLIKL